MSPLAGGLTDCVSAAAGPLATATEAFPNGDRHDPWETPCFFIHAERRPPRCSSGGTRRQLQTPVRWQPRPYWSRPASRNSPHVSDVTTRSSGARTAVREVSTAVLSATVRAPR